MGAPPFLCTAAKAGTLIYTWIARTLALTGPPFLILWTAGVHAALCSGWIMDRDSSDVPLRSRRTRALLTWMFCALFLVPPHAAAQSIHLPPPSVPLVPYDERTGQYEVLLRITPDVAGAQHALRRGATLRVFADHLVLTTPTGARTMVEYGDKTVGELADYINANFGDAIAHTSYPEYSSRYLRGTLPRELPRRGSIEIRGGEGGTMVIAEVGTVFSAGSQAGDGEALLTSAGVQVGFAAQQALTRGLYLIFRLMFNTNDPQATEVGGNGKGESANGESDPVVGILRSSQRVSTGMTLDWYPIIDTRYRFGFNLEAEFSAWREDPFDFPNADVDGTLLPLDSLYTRDRIDDVRVDLDRWRPNGSLLLGANIEFPDLSGHPTYALAQVGIASVVKRSVLYAAARGADPSTLVGLVDTRWPKLARFGLGMWVAGFVDLRGDIVVPLKPESSLEPLLRIILSKPFS